MRRLHTPRRGQLPTWPYFAAAMKRFDRIAALLIQLQAHRVVKGADLAARFGVSLRTMYRDLRTLEQAGVPLSSEAGVGYSLADGYRLPPVMFTREEATALLMAEELVAQLTDAHTAALSRTAMDKLRAVLRRPDRDYLAALSPRITILPARHPHGTPPLAANLHQLLLGSIASRQVVALDYRAGYPGVPSQREVESIGIYFGQYWHLVAFCRLRQAFRDFRLDRIAGLRVLDEQFVARPDTLQTYWAENAARRPVQAAVVRFAPEVLPHVHENKHHFGWVQETPLAEGGLEVAFRVGCLDTLARWLLLFAGQVAVVSPPELRQRARALAQAAVAALGEE